jgi:hypothetical protein
MTELDKNDLVNKFLQIESLAFKGRHLVETMNEKGMILICKHIRKDLEDLETVLGRRAK